MNNTQYDYKVKWESYQLRAACCMLLNPDDGTILSVSRKNNPDDKGLPGGKCEPGETYMDAAIRELLEETGYLAEDLEPIFMADGDTGLPVDNLTKPSLNSYNKIPCNTVTFIAKSYRKVQEITESGLVEWVPMDVICKGSFAKYNTALLRKYASMPDKPTHEFEDGEYIITIFETCYKSILHVLDTKAKTFEELIEYIIYMWRENIGNYVLPLFSRLYAEPDFNKEIYIDYQRIDDELREKIIRILRSYASTPETQTLFIREFEGTRDNYYAKNVVTKYTPALKSLFQQLHINRRD